MCKKFFYVSVRCDCLFCPLAPYFDPKNAEAYPHFGRQQPSAAYGGLWTYKRVEGACGKEERDKEGRYISCVNAPPVWGNQNDWLGSPDAKIGDRLCEGCEKGCRKRWTDTYSKEVVRPKRWKVMAEEAKKAREKAEKEAAGKTTGENAATEVGTVDGGEEVVPDTEEEATIDKDVEATIDEDAIDEEVEATIDEIVEATVDEEAIDEDATIEEDVEVDVDIDDPYDSWDEEAFDPDETFISGSEESTVDTE